MKNLRIDKVCPCGKDLYLEDLIIVEYSQTPESIWFHCRKCNAPGILLKYKTASEIWNEVTLKCPIGS